MPILLGEKDLTWHQTREQIIIEVKLPLGQRRAKGIEVYGNAGYLRAGGGGGNWFWECDLWGLVVPEEGGRSYSSTLAPTPTPAAAAAAASLTSATLNRSEIIPTSTTTNNLNEAQLTSGNSKDELEIDVILGEEQSTSPNDIPHLARSSCKIEEGIMTFILQKEPRLTSSKAKEVTEKLPEEERWEWWPSLSYTLPDKLSRRQHLEVSHLKMLKDMKEEKLERKREGERRLVREQIRVEQEGRRVVEERKEGERERARRVIEGWSQESLGREVRPGSGGTLVDADDVKGTTKGEEVKEKAEDIFSKGEESEEESSDDDINLEQIRDKVRLDPSLRKHAPPRNRGEGVRVEVRFSGRGHIPTQTARESEDAKWMARIKLQKALHALKLQESGGMPQEDHELEGKELRKKGTTFFNLGNFQGALSCFDEAIKLDPQDILSLSNRSTIHLKLSNYPSCIEDCQTTLRLLSLQEEILSSEMKIPNQDGRGDWRLKQRVKSLCKLAQAQLQSGDEEGALGSLEEALRREPGNVGVEREVLELRGRLGKLDGEKEGGGKADVPPSPTLIV